MSPRTPVALLALFSVVSLRPSAARGGDWPQWRGPDRAARAEFRAPESWPAELSLVWRVEAGAGLSSPLVADGRAYLFIRDGDEEVARALDLADGSEIWRHAYSSRFYANGGAIRPRLYPASQGKGPFATPVLRDGALYTLGVNRVMSSLAAVDGRLRWRRHYLRTDVPAEVGYYCRPCGCDHDGQEFDEPGNCPSCGMGLNPRDLETSSRSGGGNYYGAAASPLLADGLGVAHVGDLDRGLMISFDPRTGEDRWRWEGGVIAYSSPVVATIHGERQIVAMTRTEVVGLDLLSGRPRWRFEIENNAQTATPVVRGDLVIVAQYRGPTFALRVSRSGEAWSVERAWENVEQSQWLNSPVLDGDRLYGFFFSEKGHFATLDAVTGETLWAGEGRQGDAATLVLAGDHLLALKSDGNLVVLKKAGDALEMIRSYPVADAPTWTYPAVIGDKILIKDEFHLSLWSIGPAVRSGSDAAPTGPAAD